MNKVAFIFNEKSENAKIYRVFHLNKRSFVKFRSNRKSAIFKNIPNLRRARYPTNFIRNIFLYFERYSYNTPCIALVHIKGAFRWVQWKKKKKHWLDWIFFSSISFRVSVWSSADSFGWVQTSRRISRETPTHFNGTQQITDFIKGNCYKAAYSAARRREQLWSKEM